MRYRGGDRAVSVVIGAVLLLGIGVTLLALLQTNAVPVWNKEVEFTHNQEVQDDMKDLRSNVFTTASRGSPTSTSVKLGTSYPNRIVLRNPPPSTGTVTTSFRSNITIPNSRLYIDNVSVDGATGDYWDGSLKSFSTRAVHYSPKYAQYDTAPATVLENSVLYNTRENASNVSVGLTEQNFVDGRRINLVTINGSLSETQAGKVTLDTEPVSAPAQSIAVTDDGNGPVNITIPTAIPNSTWSRLLEEEHTSNGGYIEDQSYSRGDDRSYLHLKLRQGETYNLKMAKVGLGSFIQEEDQHYITAVSGNESSIPAGERQKLVAEVRDRYNNPVSGAEVNASVESGSGSVTPDSDITGEDGRVSFTYQSGAAGDAEIVMNISDTPLPREEVLFNVSVFSTGGGVTGDLVYNNDAVAADGPETDNTVPAGVNFSVTNDFSQSITITEIGIAPADGAIDFLSDDATPNGEIARSEIYVDGDASDAYSDEGGDGFTLPASVDLDTDGSVTNNGNAEVSPNADATIYLYEFEDGGGERNMTGEDVDVTVTFQLPNGLLGQKTFTITPTFSGSGGGGGGGGNAPTITQFSVTDRSNPGQGARFRVDWGVSDTDGDLSSVSLTLEHQTFGEVDSETVSVSGSTDSGTTDLNYDPLFNDPCGDDYDITLEVTDANGNSNSQTVTRTANC